MKLTKEEQKLLNAILASYVLFCDPEDGEDYDIEVKAIEGLQKKLIK